MIRDYSGASSGQARAGQMECSQEIQSLHSQSSPASCSELGGDILIGRPGLTL